MRPEPSVQNWQSSGTPGWKWMSATNGESIHKASLWGYQEHNIWKLMNKCIPLFSAGEIVIPKIGSFSPQSWVGLIYYLWRRKSKGMRQTCVDCIRKEVHWWEGNLCACPFFVILGRQTSKSASWPFRLCQRNRKCYQTHFCGWRVRMTDCSFWGHRSEQQILSFLSSGDVRRASRRNRYVKRNVMK